MRGRSGARRVPEGRDAEVEDFDASLSRDQDVLGLDVAVNDQVLMRVGDGRTYLKEQPQAIVQREILLITIAIDGHALDAFDDDVRQSAGCCAGIEQACDVRAISCAKEHPLLLKAVPARGRTPATGP